MNAYESMDQHIFRYHIIRPSRGQWVVQHIGSAPEPVVGRADTYAEAQKIAMNLEKKLQAH